MLRKTELCAVTHLPQHTGKAKPMQFDLPWHCQGVKNATSRRLTGIALPHGPDLSCERPACQSSLQLVAQRENARQVVSPCHGIHWQDDLPDTFCLIFASVYSTGQHAGPRLRVTSRLADGKTPRVKSVTDWRAGTCRDTPVCLPDQPEPRRLRHRQARHTEQVEDRAEQRDTAKDVRSAFRRASRHQAHGGVARRLRSEQGSGAALCARCPASRIDLRVLHPIRQDALSRAG